MGLMSLSYMLGDAVIRIVFGLILGAGASAAAGHLGAHRILTLLTTECVGECAVRSRAGVTWKELFYICAAIAGAMSIALLYTLKGSPLDIGEPEPVSNAANVFAQRGAAARGRRSGAARLGIAVV